ncbi:glycosyltransferase family 39 protein [Magnetospirillum aberrantis]|uniref:Glycosyltransferase RgtA/B/C/D-like domain-containing protein n=1 Tax=Magnetospirillum aberrantis SpK TaxID=908842 RepID=A0A7C9QRA9_9PROT|nr:glycosyltransferase family 39 protein [Magnetospirillum aberrantis]NFV78542.1 hypothetical protein [Magnetospirillum aberrantis SpK]
MTTVAALLFLTVSAIGWGGLALRATTGAVPRGRHESVAFAFVIGQGVLGWLTFWPAVTHMASAPVAAGLCAVGLCGLPWLARNAEPKPETVSGRPDWILRAIVLLAGVIAAGDVLEALAPPADADSLAYHFVIAKHLAETGRLDFVPRAVDGAVPPLTQLVSGLAYSLGGERAMTLWAMVSGWGLALAAYALALRWLNRRWAAAAAVTILSMPAVLFGAGTGQVEVRSAAFATIAVAVAADALTRRDRGGFVLSGVAAGCMMAAKLTGMLLVAAIGAAMLTRPYGRRQVVLFGLTAMAVGAPYYVWCWLNTGDPVFPMLWGMLPGQDPTLWNTAQAAYFKARFNGVELLLPKTVAWWLAYPLRVLVDSHPVFEAGRTGFGPWPLIAAGFALWGGWQARRTVWRSPLATWLMVAALFYSLWFWLGPSQRIRHLLPVAPLVFLVLTIAAERATRCSPARLALKAGLVLTLAVQCAGQGVFSLQYIEHLRSGETREAFLAHNVDSYQAAAWINRHLPASAKVLHERRELNYLLERASFQANPEQEGRVEVRPDNDDPALFWRQLRHQGVDHIFHTLPDDGSRTGVGGLTMQLEAAGCARQIQRFHQSQRVESRALRVVKPIDETNVLWQLTPATCPF